MRPNNSPNLFNDVGQPRIPALNEEFLRRNLVFATLNDLSAEFVAKDEVTHPVTEPALLARLYALSQVQRTRMGVVGFNPLEAVQSREGAIEAKAAPFHDEYSDESGTYRTRVIRLTMTDVDHDEIEIFGLNFFQPDLDIKQGLSEGNDGDETTNGHVSKGIVLVGERGLIGEQKPITGETVILGVRNKKTNDAKFYKVDIDTEGTYGQVSPLRNIHQESEYGAIVTLPDYTVMIVEQLTGERQQEAVKEFQSSVDRFKEKPLPTEGMSEEELNALGSVRSAKFIGTDLVEDR